MTTDELTSKRLLGRDEVAELLGIEAATVDNLHRGKVLRACRVGRENRWRPCDVERYVKELQPED